MPIDPESLLSQAQSEIRAWRAGTDRPDGTPSDVLDTLIEALDRAKRASSREALERHVESIIRLQMDQAPMTKDLMPSFYALVAMLKGASQNRHE
jgi:hypothetical protein